MRNLSKDFKGQRPMLIQPAQAEAYLNRVSDMQIPMDSKMSDMGDMLEAIFGAKQTLEKFPPYAVIPVKGVIGKNLSELESMCGCCDIEDIEEMLEECERDTSIKTIILDIDSPGGTSVGVPELANRVKNCSKKVISFTASECCSAAYWIGSQASEFYATPSSSVGSIGVYIAFPDCSEAYRMEGVKMDVIKSGAYKGAGIPGTSLDDNQRRMLQEEVSDIHSDFKAAVKSVRSFVEDSSMEGQMFSGKRGAEAGLVTSLTNGFDELMSSMDKQVHAQMEADEENDDRHAVSGLIESEHEEREEGEEESYQMTASARALSGISVNLSPEAKKEEDDEDNEDKDKEDYEGKSEKGDEGEEGIEPQPDSKGDAEDEDDNGEKAVDTDAKHDNGSVKKNRSKKIA